MPARCCERVDVADRDGVLRQELDRDDRRLLRNDVMIRPFADELLLARFVRAAGEYHGQGGSTARGPLVPLYEWGAGLRCGALR
jgi:hypothetical protein